MNNLGFNKMLKGVYYGAGVVTVGTVGLAILLKKRKAKQEAVQRIADRRRIVTEAAITASVRFPCVTDEKANAISNMNLLQLKAALENGSITSEEILLT